MKNIQIVLISLISLLQATIIEVGGEDSTYMSIQSAIDDANVGDTILVYPGNWEENINFNGKDVVLTSNYMFDNNPATIRTTIINGHHSGSCVSFISGESRAAVLNGFSLVEGSGIPFSSLQYLGGGLYIYNSNPSITNCILRNNHIFGRSANGSGAFVGFNSNPFFSNITIKENQSDYQAGGLGIFESFIEFDTLNPCNIYNNYAGESPEIWHNDWDSVQVPIYLDTFTVAQPDSYFVWGFFSDFHIEHGVIQPVNHDLYVSPNGDDTNSGLTAASPVKTISHALTIIHADADNPHTIFLLPGVYSITSNDEKFPLNLRSFVSLEGSGIDITIISLEDVKSMGFDANQNEHDYSISNMTIQDLAMDITYSQQAGIEFNHNNNVSINNIKFINMASRSITCNMATLVPVIPESNIKIENCSFTQSVGIKAALLMHHKSIIVKNCVFQYNTPWYPTDWFANGGGLQISGADTAIHTTYRRIENCLFTDNFSDNDFALSGAASIEIYESDIVDIVNCTFSDNISTDFANIGVDGWGTEVRMVNNICYNNDPYEIYLDGRVSSVENPVKLILSHNLIERGEWGIGRAGNWDIQWLDDNIDNNPQFIDPENDDYHLLATSQAIDAGTSLFIWEEDTVLNLTPDQYVGTAPDLGCYEYDATQGVNPGSAMVPEKLTISSLYPNPFNSELTLDYDIPARGKTTITIYDINGGEVSSIIDAVIAPGHHSTTIDFSQMASGAYIIKIKQGRYSDTRTVTLLK